MDEQFTIEIEPDAAPEDDVLGSLAELLIQVWENSTGEDHERE